MEPRDRFGSSVRARKELEIKDVEGNESDIFSSENNASASDDSNDNLSSNASGSPAPEEAQSPTSSHESPTGINALNNISFGALSRAQASLPSSHKRKRTPSPSPPPSTLPTSVAPPFKPSRKPPARSSHHAPQVLSTRHAVPRFRNILDPKPTAARDPRFDATVTTQNSGSLALASQAANRNYAFLTGYRESEVEGLRGQLRALTKKTKKKGKPGGEKEGLGNEAEVAGEVRRLEREIARLTAHLRTAEQKGKVKEVEREHKRKERERVASGGKGAWFLKKGEARKMVEKERVEGLGKRKREKAVRRREGRERKKGMGLGAEMGMGKRTKTRM